MEEIVADFLGVLKSDTTCEICVGWVWGEEATLLKKCWRKCGGGGGVGQ
jgi:hypothetical protein